MVDFSLFQLSLYARRQYRLESFRMIIIIVIIFVRNGITDINNNMMCWASVRVHLSPIEISYKSEIAWAGFTVLFVADGCRHPSDLIRSVRTEAR